MCIRDSHFTGTEIKGADDRDHFVKSIEALKNLPEGGLVFANLVDLDSNFGHRRDVAGYALGLETFDSVSYTHLSGDL